MKIFFDFLPVLLFFGSFKYAEAHAEWAARFASEHLGFIVSGGVVGTEEAPVLLATVVVIAATLLQVAVQVVRLLEDRLAVRSSEEPHVVLTPLLRIRDTS